MRKISTTLNTKDLNRAIKELESYKKELKIKINLLMELIIQAGVEVAKVQVVELGAKYSGELESSIGGAYDAQNHTGVIYAGAWYAVYVEFGTGVVGKGSPHPIASEKNWKYDVNEHGEMGWVFLDERDGTYHWTQGFASRPFMYNTARQLETIIPRIAKEVFSR